MIGVLGITIDTPTLSKPEVSSIALKSNFGSYVHCTALNKSQISNSRTTWNKQEPTRFKTKNIFRLKLKYVLKLSHLQIRIKILQYIT